MKCDEMVRINVSIDDMLSAVGVAYLNTNIKETLHVM